MVQNFPPWILIREKITKNTRFHIFFAKDSYFWQKINQNGCFLWFFPYQKFLGETFKPYHHKLLEIIFNSAQTANNKPLITVCLLRSLSIFICLGMRAIHRGHVNVQIWQKQFVYWCWLMSIYCWRTEWFEHQCVHSNTSNKQPNAILTH